MGSFKNKILRKGNKLKTPKLHQMLHVVDYIIIHGYAMDYDGSRGDNFGKLQIKDNAKITNTQKDVLNFDIRRRINKKGIVDDTSTVYYHNEEYWSSQCNETYITVNANRL